MDQLSEYSARLAESYRLKYDERNRLSVGLAGYLTIAGGLMLLSGMIFNDVRDGETHPMMLVGVGLCSFVGGGIYWLHCRDTHKRLSKELETIERHFTAKGKRIYPSGRVEDIQPSYRTS